MEDMVNAVVVARALDGSDAGGFFDDADEVLIAGGAGAVDAGINVGDVIADGTEAQAGLELANCVGEGGGVFVAGAQDMEGVALGGFCANTGKLFELFDEASHRLGIAGHGSRV